MKTNFYFKPGPVRLRTNKPAIFDTPLPDIPMPQQLGRLLQQWNDQQDWVVMQRHRRRTDALALVIFTITVTLVTAAAGLLLRGMG